MSERLKGSLATRPSEAQAAISAYVRFDPYLVAGVVCSPLKPYAQNRGPGSEVAELVYYCMFTNIGRVMHSVAMEQLQGSRQAGDWVPVTKVIGTCLPNGARDAGQHVDHIMPSSCHIFHYYCDSTR